jgi:cytochrome o ubiquinol oxidase operon protein cyoD
MTTDLSLQETKKEWHGTLKSYLIGFVASLLLTAISFSLVVTKFLSGNVLIYTLIGLALVQAIVQLLLFLHVGQEDKPRWETISFCFMVMCVLIIVIGSLWIMSDLDERVMSGMHKEMSHD